jgi:hypothetical protein
MSLIYKELTYRQQGSSDQTGITYGIAVKLKRFINVNYQ